MVLTMNLAISSQQNIGLVLGWLPAKEGSFCNSLKGGLPNLILGSEGKEGDRPREERVPC